MSGPLPGTTQTYVNDDADKLTSITQGGNTVKSFTYDTAGRTTAVTVGANTTTVAYDYEGRISTITYPNTSTNTFTYNGLDTRVGKVDSVGTKTYLRDGAGVTAPLLNDGAANYTPGVSERRSSATINYHGGIKNAESQTNTSQSVTATQTFDAFGNADTSSGTWKGPLGYGGIVGYQSDSDSALMLLGHRYCDPSTGRFLTRDPARNGRNWYVYCDSKPMVAADPDGLDTLVFNGSKVKHFDSNGNLIHSYPARSGKPGSTPADQFIPGFGPIPEGYYYVQKWEVQKVSYHPTEWNNGRPETYPPIGNWGKKRIPIHVSPETVTNGRDGFFIHGGGRPQTAGCIQVDGSDNLLTDIANGDDRVIKLVVKYPPKPK